jgi:hypothetical protein
MAAQITIFFSANVRVSSQKLGKLPITARKLSGVGRTGTLTFAPE